MSRVLVFLAEGFEETEALCPVDVLRRAKIDVVLAGIGSSLITSSHGVVVKTDIVLTEEVDEAYDAVFCPGGMPGAVNIAECWAADQLIIKAANRAGAIVAAICASPAVVLGPLGLLNGKKATTYPGTEGYSPNIHFLSDGVVEDGNVITAKSAGYAFDLGLKLVERLKGRSEAERIKNQIYYKEDK